MPPRRSPSSKQLPTVPTHEVGTKPIQTTTNSVPKLQMPMSESAVPLTEANLNAAGGNTKASAVTVHDSEGPSTVASSKRQGPAHGSSASSYEDQRRQLLKKSATKSANPTSRGFSLRRLAIQLTALYAIIAYFFICPSDPSRAPAVCKSYADLQSYRDTAVSYARPYYQPYITQAQETLDPYYQPYAKLAAPVYTKAQRYVQPQIAQARNVYNRAVHPKLLNALTHSQKQAQPHFDRLSYEYERLVGPYTHRYTRLASEIYDLNVKPTYDAIARDTNKFVQPLYRQSSAYLSPVLAKAYPATRHHVQHTFLPFASSSFSTSKKVYGEQVHPRLASTFQLLIRFVREKLGPAIARFQSRYISPQLNKIQDKAFAYKAKSVASEKVASLDKELGKDVIDDEIEELLSEIKQTTTPAFTSVVPTGTEGTARVEPTALDNFAGTEEKEDVIAKKIQEEEAQLVQRAEKRKAIEALHDLYEVEIQKLGETEAALLADRLTQLRKAALRDIPNRFDVSVRNYRDECDKWVGRLDKFWDKANRDERTSTENKISDGVLIARKAGSKLADQAEELEDEVDAYLRTHVVREVTSTEKAFKTVESFVGKAQDELGMGYAYLDDVTHADWQRYHVLQAMEGQWHHQLFGMRNGSVAHPQLDRSLAVEPVLANLKIELEKLSSEADARLVASRTRGEKRVKGQFLGVADAAERGYEAVRGAVSGGSDAVASAVTGASQVVFGEPEPTDLSGSISSTYTEATSTASSVLADSTDSVVSLASEASASVDSLYSAASGGATNVVSSISSFLLPTNVAKALDDATSSLQFGYGEASQSLVRLAGLQPSPTNAQQSATYFLAQATSYLADAQGSANAVLASYASEASKTAMSLAGQTATPTDLQGSAASAYSEATSAAALYADAAASEISLAANNAQGLFASVVASAYAALPTVSLPSSDDLPALSDVSATLSSQVHRATREAAKAVGISVTPESLQEHAESVYSQAASAASSVSASAASVLPTIPAGSLHEATRAAQRAVGISPSPESPAEYAESAYSQVVDAASAALSSASAALPTVQFDASALSSSLDQATRSAKSAIGLQGTPEGVAASASSLLQQASNSLHDATRTAIRAVGATPSPEGFVEHAESLASSVSEAVVSATESVRQRVEL